MILRHIHLPSVVAYSHAAALQHRLVTSLLAHKASASTIPAPPPTILTAQFSPVYTCGRREIGTVSPAQIKHLTQETSLGNAEFVEALRGGQTTFHGPGQLIAYPIIDLKRHNNITPRCYVRLLENTVIDLCRAYGVETRTTEHPGVWVNDMEKICAVGVHLRRNVTSHGIALNASTEMGWFERIVGCGLQGKSATSLLLQGVELGRGVDEAAEGFVRVFADRLGGVESIVKVKEGDVD